MTTDTLQDAGRFFVLALGTPNVASSIFVRALPIPKQHISSDGASTEGTGSRAGDLSLSRGSGPANDEREGWVAKSEWLILLLAHPTEKSGSGFVDASIRRLYPPAKI